MLTNLNFIDYNTHIEIKKTRKKQMLVNLVNKKINNVNINKKCSQVSFG